MGLYHSLFVRPPVYIQSCCLMVVDAPNKVITNSHVQVSLTARCYFCGAKSSIGMAGHKVSV